VERQGLVIRMGREEIIGLGSVPSNLLNNYSSRGDPILHGSSLPIGLPHQTNETFVQMSAWCADIDATTERT